MELRFKPEGNTLSSILNIYAAIFTVPYLLIGLPLIKIFFELARVMETAPIESQATSFMKASVYLVVIGYIFMYLTTLFMISGMVNFFRKMNSYILTDNGLLVRTGMLAPKTRLISWQNIHNLQIEQNKLQDIFNIGNIKISTKGNSSLPATIVLYDIKTPSEIRFHINKYLNNL